MRTTMRIYSKSYRQSGRDALILVTLFVFAFIIRQLTIIRPYADVWDIYYYLTLARNMITGNGYTIMGEDLGYYLPGYPVIVAIISLFIGDIEFSALLISTIVGSLTIPLTFLMIKTVSNEKMALLSSSLVLINPQHITHTSRAISEATATLLAVVSIYLLILAIREKSNIMMWLCTFITGALFLTRYPSLLFFPIILVILLLMRKWISWPSKTMFLAVMIVLFCLSSIWFLRNFLIFGDPFQSVYVTQQESGVALLGGYLGVLRRNLLYYSTKGIPFYTLTPLVTIFFVYGLFTSIRNVKINAIFYIWLALGSLHFILWAGNPQPRYLCTLVPALSLFAGQGVLNLYHYIENKTRNFRFSTLKEVFILVFILGTFVSSYYITINHNYFLELQYDRIAFRRAAMWINLNTPSDSLIVTTKPMLFHYYTNRTCVYTSTYFKQPTLFPEKHIYYIFDNLDGENFENEINWEQFVRKFLVTFERATIDNVIYIGDTFPFLYSESHENIRVVTVFQISLG